MSERFSNDALADNNVSPWYRQFWAWFILIPLIVVVLVGISLLVISIKGSQDIVIDDYYKVGRMINQVVVQDKKASELGLLAELRFDLEVGGVLLNLSSSAGAVLPKTLLLYLDHPLEEDYDQSITMHQVLPGTYRADLEHKIDQRWYIRLTTDPKTTVAGENWRIIDELNLSVTQQIIMGSHE
jgi:hypothetical protein